MNFLFFNFFMIKPLNHDLGLERERERDEASWSILRGRNLRTPLLLWLLYFSFFGFSVCQVSHHEQLLSLSQLVVVQTFSLTRPIAEKLSLSLSLSLSKPMAETNGGFLSKLGFFFWGNGFHQWGSGVCCFRKWV